MGKFKGIIDDNKIDNHRSKGEPYCKQWKEDILFEFGHITELKGYSYEALINGTKNDENILRDYLRLINVMSSNNWTGLTTLGRKAIGGFETMALSNFNKHIEKKYNPNMPKDVKLHIFRFGSGDRYRMIGYKSPNCSRTIHILGFDLDHSLYDHGS